MSYIFFKGQEILAISHKENNARTIGKRIIEANIEGIKVAHANEILDIEDIWNFD